MDIEIKQLEKNSIDIESIPKLISKPLKERLHLLGNLKISLL